MVRTNWLRGMVLLAVLFFGCQVAFAQDAPAKTGRSRCVVDEPQAPKEAMKCNDFTFDATSSYDPNNKKISVLWDFGDGTTSDQPVVKHSYAKSGEYNVVLKVTNGTGVSCDTSTSTQKVMVSFPPTADFDVSGEGCINNDLVFDASTSKSESGTLNYSWDFGDGTKADGAKVTKAFKQGGFYNVRLVVDDGSQSPCSMDTITKKIRINSAPIANAGRDMTLYFKPGEEMKVNFDGSASKDEEGDPMTYMWDFGDGATAEGAKVSHVYAAPGTYTAKLTVKDDSGLSCNTSMAPSLVNVTVSHAPKAYAGPVETACVNDDVTFDGSGSTADTGRTIKYSWIFGDGSKAEGVTVKHAYAKAGDYKAVLTVDDGSGSKSAISSSVKEVKVGASPVARLAEVKTVEAGERVTLDASGSSTDSGSLKYAWDFGDGAVQEGGATMSHVYAKGGTYTVRVTVEKVLGSACRPVPVACNRDMASTTVKVNTPPTADAGPNLVCCVGKETMFDGSFSSDADGDALMYKWSFGDGGTAEGAKVTHTYTKQGTYKVKLTVDDGRNTRNSKSTDSFTATVLGKPVSVIKVK